MSHSEDAAITADLQAIGRLTALPAMLDVVCRHTGMGFAAVAKVTRERWTACLVRDQIGLGLGTGSELPVGTTICHEIEASGQAVVIDEVAADLGFRQHPTPKLYGFESYISVPIRRRDGRFFGTLCALDPQPRRVSDARTVAMFEAFADLIGFQREAEDALSTSRTALADQRHEGDRRERFIAAVGHDLRNPLQAITASAELLLRLEDLPEKAGSLVRNIQHSGQRMAGLLDNLLDFARGRLGGGFTLRPQWEPELQAVLHGVVQELQTVHATRAITVDLRVDQPVFCDPGRIAQILSNLLANALVHGAQAQPVAVRARIDGNDLTVSVTNAGAPIPPAAMAELFRPFVRSRDVANSRGLGLGLYIASQLAQSHGGTLAVTSDAEATTFALRMPRAGPATPSASPVAG